jgi:amino acid transporter
MSYRTAAGRLVTVGRRLASGGEGEVYAVSGRPELVFKKYKPEALAKAPETEAKVRAMTARPPAEWREASSGHVALAWPSEVVLENGRFTGFLMPAIDTGKSVELHRIANPSDRRGATGRTEWLRGFNWQYLVRTAANLAHATRLLHASGSVIGDFNERNIFVTAHARVTLIDCDSMQFTASSGRTYLCRVGRPEFTSPELARVDWKKTVRQPSSDLFALAIHLFQLLMQGEHPFRGVWSGPGEKPSVSDLAEWGTWMSQRGGRLSPRPKTIGMDLLPDSIREMFRRAFEDGATRPERRPTAADWQQALNSLAGSLRRCKANRQHYYPPHCKSCPWCAHELRYGTGTTTVPVMSPVTAQAPTVRTPAPATAYFMTPPTVQSPLPAVTSPAPTVRTPTVRTPAPATTASLTDAGLRSRAGRGRLFMVSAGSIFGAGWLFGAGYAAQFAGPASLLAWLIGGIAAVLLALVTAELSAMFPVAGGLARFPARAFGGVVGAAFGWTAWLQAATVTALEVVTVGTLVAQWGPDGFLGKLAQAGAGQPTGKGYLFAAALTVFFTVLNFAGVGTATWLNSVLTWVKLGIIGLAIAVLCLHFREANLTKAPHGLLPYGAGSVFSAVGSGGIMFAYLGFEQAGHLAGEARNPKRDIPWAIIGSVLLATVVYIALAVAFMGALPLADVARGWGGGSVSVTDLARARAMPVQVLTVLRAAPLIGVLGVAVAYSVTAPRLAYGLGRSGIAPAALAKTGRGVPWAAAAVTLAACLILLGPGTSWQRVVADLTSASALMYAGAPLCLGAFRRQFPAQARPYRLPGAALLGPVAFAVATLIVYWCGWEATERIGIALIIGTCVLLVLRRPVNLNLAAAGWLAAYLAGLAILSRMGRYGGSGTLPMWWDTAIVALFSLVIYAWAMRTRL